MHLHGTGEGLVYPSKQAAAIYRSTMSRAKSAVVFSGSDPVARRARMGRSMSLAPTRERRRSAMGEYIGERPLSAAYHPTPGPADYHPRVRLSLPNAPCYSLHKRPDPPKIVGVRPSPNTYDTSKDLNWAPESNKTISLKKKDITWPYDTRKYAEITESPGAGHYRRRDSEVGTGLKRSLSARHKEGIHAGYPNTLIIPVDTLGFSTPGPYLFRPESERGPKHVLGLQLKKEDDETLGPGPAAYDLPSEAIPAPKIGERLDREQPPVTPAPNKYSLPSTIPPARETGKSFGLRRELKSAHVAPPPNVYTIERPRTASAHFTYRAFPDKTEERPGPKYKPSLTDCPTLPEYSCRTQCKPVFPDVLQYPENATTVTPGAGTYEYDREFADNDDPSYSIALPLPQKPNANPAPNQYDVKHSSLSSLRRPPSCKLGQRSTSAKADHTSGPGPAAYNTRPESAKHSGGTITPRRPLMKGSSGPAPNAYAINKGTTAKGRSTGPAASMKSRHTPQRYSGFPSSYLTALQTLS